MKNATGGFTLIELLIVIAIIGILAAVLIPNLLSARVRAFDAAAQACARDVSTKQEIYQVDNRAYGTTAQLVGDYAPTCDGDVVWDVTANSSTNFTATASHEDSSAVFTVSNTGGIVRN